MKHYDLSNIEQLYKFDEDCVNACSECPQSYETGRFERWDTVSIAQVFEYWQKNDLLEGYYEKYLTAKARATFANYALFRNGDIICSTTYKIYKANDTFRVKTKIVKE